MEPATLAARYAALVTEACRTIDRANRVPALRALAEQSGLSAHHFHRVFRAVTGLTPRAYAEAHRAARTRAALSAAPSVTDAIYEAGFVSSGRFYERATENLGMTPTTYRAGGRNLEIVHGTASCALGTVLVGQTARGICAVMLGDRPDDLVVALQQRFSLATFVPAGRQFRETLAAVVALIDAPDRPFDLPVDLHGTIFQRRVWQALRGIAAGTTISYSELAARIGAPSSVRAVARACGANPVAVVVPCHRVVGSGGALTGYRWGVVRKQALLDRERDAPAESSPSTRGVRRPPTHTPS
jgi:AraC family transcriptional regulator of adaptative response/methylated-DNA-[protein]-cysteine methyltransferase